MQDIVDEVLRAEAEAKRIVEEARKTASQLRDGVEHESRSELEQARLEAQQQVEEQVRSAQEAIAARYAQSIEGVEHEGARFMEDHAAKIDTLVDEIVEFLSTPEYKRG